MIVSYVPPVQCTKGTILWYAHYLSCNPLCFRQYDDGECRGVDDPVEGLEEALLGPPPHLPQHPHQAAVLGHLRTQVQLTNIQMI